MANNNIRSVVVGPKTWSKLKTLGKKEERSMSELIREAILDLFDKRTRPKTVNYDPVADKFNNLNL